MLRLYRLLLFPTSHAIFVFSSSLFARHRAQNLYPFSSCREQRRIFSSPSCRQTVSSLLTSLRLFAREHITLRHANARLFFITIVLNLLVSSSSRRLGCVCGGGCREREREREFCLSSSHNTQTEFPPHCRGQNSRFLLIVSRRSDYLFCTRTQRSLVLTSSCRLHFLLRRVRTTITTSVRYHRIFTMSLQNPLFCFIAFTFKFTLVRPDFVLDVVVSSFTASRPLTCLLHHVAPKFCFPLRRVAQTLFTFSSCHLSTLVFTSHVQFFFVVSFSTHRARCERWGVVAVPSSSRRAKSAFVFAHHIRSVSLVDAPTFQVLVCSYRAAPSLVPLSRGIRTLVAFSSRKKRTSAPYRIAPEIASLCCVTAGRRIFSTVAQIAFKCAAYVAPTFYTSKLLSYRHYIALGDFVTSSLNLYSLAFAMSHLSRHTHDHVSPPTHRTGTRILLYRITSKLLSSPFPDRDQKRIVSSTHLLFHHVAPKLFGYLFYCVISNFYFASSSPSRPNYPAQYRRGIAS
jgi:hypothetical protein